MRTRVCERKGERETSRKDKHETRRLTSVEPEGLGLETEKLRHSDVSRETKGGGTRLRTFTRCPTFYHSKIPNETNGERVPSIRTRQITGHRLFVTE